jgi:hypothetical protein
MKIGLFLRENSAKVAVLVLHALFVAMTILDGVMGAGLSPTSLVLTYSSLALGSMLVLAGKVDRLTSSRGSRRATPSDKPVPGNGSEQRHTGRKERG